MSAIEPPINTVRPRRVKLAARIDCTSVPTATRVWDANGLIECVICEVDIPAGDLFTMALAEGHGRRHVPHCRTCRPFMVERLGGWYQQ